MMRLCPLVMIMAGLLVVQTARGQDNDDNKPPDQQRTELMQEAQSEAQQLKSVQAKSIGQVLQFAVEHGDLVLHSSLGPTDGYARLNVAGLPRFCKVQIDAGGTDSFQLIDQQFPPDGIVVLTMIFAIPGQLQISRDRDSGDLQTNVQLIQSDQYTADGEGKVKLYINITSRDGRTIEDKRLSAANILELRRKYPLELAKYVEPIFRELHQEAVLGQVDPKLAWQVFAPLYQPDAKLHTEVEALVRQLDVEDFAQREAASKQLEKLSPPAAILLMRLNRRGLSDEQQTRIDALLAPYKPVSEAEAGKLRTDKFFLADCLYCDDVRIRRWAIEQLGRVLGHPVAFNVSANRSARVEAIAGLRRKLLGAPDSGEAATEPGTSDEPASAPSDP